MLQVPAEFPHIGSTAFLRGSAGEVRILQRNADGTATVQRLGLIPRAEGASITRRVAQADLFATIEEAMGPADKPRRHRRARRSRRAQAAEGGSAQGSR